jgi:glucuronosyltransferase
MPLFADQFTNAMEAERLGIGKSLPIHELDEEKLFAVITQVLDEPRYAEMAKKYGQLVTDDIVKPMDKVSSIKP